MGKGRRWSVVVIAAMAVGVAAAPANAADWTITGPAGGVAWDPPNRTIQTGDKVTWVFASGSSHNVKSTSANWSLGPTPLPTTNPVSYTFTATGTYTFVCEIHAFDNMTGTITVQDEPVDQPPDDPPPDTPPPSSPPPSGDPHPITPPPAATTDTVKPTVRGLRTTALRRAVRVRFRLSEAATVTVRVKRRGKVVKAANVHASAGTHSVTLRSKRLKKGRYTVDIRARDAVGNRSKLATKRLTLRR